MRSKFEEMILAKAGKKTAKDAKQGTTLQFLCDLTLQSLPAFAEAASAQAGVKCIPYFRFLNDIKSKSIKDEKKDH